MCSAEITLVDADTGEMIVLAGDNISIMDEAISFSLALLTMRHHYYLSVLSNVAGSAVYNTRLSEQGNAVLKTVMFLGVSIDITLFPIEK